MFEGPGGEQPPREKRTAVPTEGRAATAACLVADGAVSPAQEPEKGISPAEVGRL